jgi:hypothetical protein
VQASTNGFVVANVTNGLATVAYANSVTNGLASQVSLTAATNGLDTIAHVNANGTASTNFSLLIGAAGTNQSLVIGLAATNYAGVISNLQSQFALLLAGQGTNYNQFNSNVLSQFTLTIAAQITNYVKQATNSMASGNMNSNAPSLIVAGNLTVTSNLIVNSTFILFSNTISGGNGSITPMNGGWNIVSAGSNMANEVINQINTNGFGTPAGVISVGGVTANGFTNLNSTAWISGYNGQGMFSSLIVGGAVTGAGFTAFTNGLATVAYVTAAINTATNGLSSGGGSGNVSSNAAFTIFSGGASFGGSGLVTSNLTATALTLTQPISISNVVATGLSPGQLLIVGPGGTIVSSFLSTNVSAIGKTVFFYATNVTGIQELVISNTAASNTFELFADGSIVENSAATYALNGVRSGNNSFAVGAFSTATNNSFAFGGWAGLDINSLTSDGYGYDVAIGNGAIAFGYNGGNAFAFGYNSLASGGYSYALGENANAVTNGSIAIGSSAFATVAQGINAFALGDGTTAHGDNSTAIGGNFVVTMAGNSIGIAPAGTHLNVIVTNSVSIAATNGVLISGGTNMVSITGGIASLSSNALAAATISFPLTTVKWTNSFGKNIVLYINNSGVTGTAIAENGTTIFTIVSGDCTLYLKPGDYFAETYTVGSPTATWIPL